MEKWRHYVKRCINVYETVRLCLGFLFLFTKGIPSCHCIINSDNSSNYFSSSLSSSSQSESFSKNLSVNTFQSIRTETTLSDNFTQTEADDINISVSVTQVNSVETKSSLTPIDSVLLKDSILSGPSQGSIHSETETSGQDLDGALPSRGDSGRELELQSSHNLSHEGNLSASHVPSMIKIDTGSDMITTEQKIGSTLNFPGIEINSNFNLSQPGSFESIELSFETETTNRTDDGTLGAQMPTENRTSEKDLLVSHGNDGRNSAGTPLQSPQKPSLDNEDIEKFTPPFQVEIGGKILKSCEDKHFCKTRCSPPELQSLKGATLSRGGLVKFQNPKNDAEADDEESEEKKVNGVHVVCPVKSDNLIGFDCSCDEKCIFFKDCCADMFHECLGLHKTDNITDHITSMRNTTMAVKPPERTLRQAWEGERIGEQVDDLDQFLLLYGSCVRLNEDSGLWAISKCPVWNRDKELRDACERPSSVILPPLTVVFTDGALVFRNFHCLKCHNMEDTSPVLWETEIICSGFNCAEKKSNMPLEEVMQQVKSGEFKVHFTSHLMSCDSRWCKHSSTLTPDQEFQIQSTASEEIFCTGSDVLLCRSYVFAGSEVRNPQCEKCLGENQRSERATGDKRCWNTPPGHQEIAGGLLTILDVSGQFSVGAQRWVTLCPENFVWDPFVHECKELICGLGSTPYKGKCVPSSEPQYVLASEQLFPLNWHELKLQILLSPYHRLNCNQKGISRIGGSFNFDFKIDELVINSTTSGLFRTFTINSLGGTPCTSNYFPIDEVDMETIGLHARIDVVASLDVLENIKAYARLLSDFVVNVVNETIELSITNQVSQFNCSSGNDPIKTDRFYWKRNEDGIVYASVQEQFNKRFYQLSSIGLELTLTTDTEGNTALEENVVLCNADISLLNPNCSVVSYLKNETSVNQSGLYVLSSGLLYQEGQFEIQANRVLVCSDFDFVTRDTGGTDTIYVIVSSCLTAASVFCLLLMVLLYIYLPELRTLPGQMTATLAGCMAWNFLFTQLTLSDMQNKYICPCLAALNHLSVLASFGWMSAIAVNMALTFGPRKLSSMTSARSKAQFIRYSIVVWGISCLIVTSSVLTDVVNHRPSAEETTPSRSGNSTAPETSPKEDNYPRYGIPSCTWFSGPLWVRLTFIIVPYIISFIINIACFFVTLICIQKSLKNGEKLGKKSSERVRCLIYVKLSTAMGFSWVLSFFLQMDSTEALQYVVVTMMLLQGVFLTLAFMANRRVLSLFLKRIRKDTKYMTSSAQTKSTNVKSYSSSRD